MCGIIAEFNIRERKNQGAACEYHSSNQNKTLIANNLLQAQLLDEQEFPEESIACVIPLRGQAENISF